MDEKRKLATFIDMVARFADHHSSAYCDDCVYYEECSENDPMDCNEMVKKKLKTACGIDPDDCGSYFFCWSDGRPKR